MASMTIDPESQQGAYQISPLSTVQNGALVHSGPPDRMSTAPYEAPFIPIVSPKQCSNETASISVQPQPSVVEGSGIMNTDSLAQHSENPAAGCDPEELSSGTDLEMESPRSAASCAASDVVSPPSCSGTSSQEPTPHGLSNTVPQDAASTMQSETPGLESCHVAPPVSLVPPPFVALGDIFPSSLNAPSQQPASDPAPIPHAEPENIEGPIPSLPCTHRDEINLTGPEEGELMHDASLMDIDTVLPSEAECPTPETDISPGPTDVNEAVNSDTLAEVGTCKSHLEYPLKSPDLPPSSPPSSQVSDMRLSQGQPQSPSSTTSLPGCVLDAPDLTSGRYDEEESCLPSSPFRSSPEPSSPGKLFSSSPRSAYPPSPPSSPPPIDCLFELDGKTTVGPPMTFDDPIPEDQSTGVECFMCDEVPSHKEDEATSPDCDTTHLNVPGPMCFSGQSTEPSKAISSPPKPLNPIRPTQASQRRQHKKLTTPFRSPLRLGITKVAENGSHPTTEVPRLPGVEPTIKHVQETNVVSITREQTARSKTAQYTESAAKQFRSPFVQPATGNASAPQSVFASATGSAIPNAASTIQALQTKVQKLRQAIKIKNGDHGEEDAKLEALVKKWKTVGQEVAWEVWGTVKDYEAGEMGGISNHRGRWDEGEISPRAGHKRAFDEIWGYGNDTKRARMGEYEYPVGQGEGEDTTMSPGGEERRGHTLGTMLRYMGIAPETLGWDEDEGDFVDAS